MYMKCWLFQLLFLLLLFFDTVCAAEKGPSRIVVTLHQYNACEVFGNSSSSCATVAKCYGRRLVLNVAACNVFDEKLEEWVRDELGIEDAAMVEEDSAFVVSEAVNASVGESSYDETVEEDLMNSTLTNSVSVDQWNLRAIHIYELWEEH